MVRFKKRIFLWKIVTGDEIWIYYNNPTNKKQRLSPCQSAATSYKPDINRKKVILCVWSDIKGIIYHELLEPNKTINVERY